MRYFSSLQGHPDIVLNLEWSILDRATIHTANATSNLSRDQLNDRLISRRSDNPGDLRFQDLHYPLPCFVTKCERSLSTKIIKTTARPIGRYHIIHL